MPPLRERVEDIIPLAESLIEKLCLENHTERKQLTEGACEKLLNYRWPGNVRELNNVIERAVIMDTNAIIEADELTLHYGVQPATTGKTLHELEKQLIMETLRTHENPTKVAETLGISLKMLRDKLQEHKIH